MLPPDSQFVLNFISSTSIMMQDLWKDKWQIPLRTQWSHDLNCENKTYKPNWLIIDINSPAIGLPAAAAIE